MPELVLTTLKFLFLALLYVFVARAVRVIWLDLAGPRPAKQKKATTHGGVMEVRPPPRRRAAARGARPATLIVAEDGMKPKTHPLSADAITIGRADSCTVTLNDTYVSQMHTRVFSKDGSWFVEDLGSTNGTYLNGMRVTDPTPMSLDDEVRLGKTIVRLGGK